MRVLIILNPGADRGRATRLKDELLSWGNKLGELEVLLTEAPEHALTLAREAAAGGYERIGAAGGDGTAHEIINGLMALPQAERLPLGLIPIGSGNDYAYGLGVLAPPRAALERLFTGAPRPLDLALVADNLGRRRHVCNGIGVGFDAAVAIASSRIRWLYGFPAYFVAALRTIAFHYERPTLQLRFDGEEVGQRSLLLAVGVGPRIGGGFLLTPDASFDDGLLDSCLVNPVPRATMMRMMPRVMKGTHVTTSFVTMRRSRQIELSSDMPLPIHLDGEIFARPGDGVYRLTVDTVPGAFDFIS